jgi:hypothetical protein
MDKAKSIQDEISRRFPGMGDRLEVQVVGDDKDSKLPDIKILGRSGDSLMVRTSGDIENAHFADMINDPKNPLTNEDLRKLVDRFPKRWGKFAHLIGKLKH